MAVPIWMLELGRACWRLHVLREDAREVVASAEFSEAELVAQAELIKSALAADGYRGEAIVLALASSWCLAATLPIDRPQELRDRQTLLYRLEEWIPWGAEEFVADFHATGSMALAAAVPCEPLAAFFHRLAECGVTVQNILPLTLLAASEHAERHSWPESHIVAIEHNGWIDLVGIEDAKLTTWCSLPASSATIYRQLHVLTINSGRPECLVSYGLNTTIRDELGQCPSSQAVPNSPATEMTPIHLALSAAEKMLVGHIEPPLELKQGPFGRNRGNVALRRYAAALQVAVVVLVLSSIIALVYRGHTGARQAAVATAQQADVFQSAFPNTKVPIGIVTRLRSELAKLMGLHGDDSALPSNIAAISVLQRLLKAVPTDKRFRFLEIRIEEGRLYLDGEARDHSDAELIAQRLRAEGLEVSSPKTQRLDDQRISLRITATLVSTGKLALRSAP